MDKHREATALLDHRPGAAPLTRMSRHRIPGFDFERLVRRVRSEYLEMPGLTLTLRQAQRMWHMTPGECEGLLRTLVDSGFLAMTPGGAFVRAGSGRSGA
jgi:hypothetical protein